MPRAGTNTGASREYGERVVGFSADSSVWYTWQSTINGLVNVTLGGSSFDTVLAVYGSGTSVSTIEKARARVHWSGSAKRIVTVLDCSATVLNPFGCGGVLLTCCQCRCLLATRNS